MSWTTFKRLTCVQFTEVVLVSVFIVNVKHFSHFFLAFILLTLNIYLTVGKRRVRTKDN